MRYFISRVGRYRCTGIRSHTEYVFVKTAPTLVADEDVNQFLLSGSPERMDYPVRECDSQGNPVGPWPPVKIPDPVRAPLQMMMSMTLETVMEMERRTDPLLRHWTDEEISNGRRFF